MRLVFVTQRVDPDHPLLGATVAKIRALAALCDEVVVLADEVVPCDLPRNVRFHAFASGSRAGRGLRFAWALGRELVRRPRPLAVVAHMCPVYAVLAAPLARPLGVKVVLWFTHWKRTPTLVAATRLSQAVVTVDTASVPLASRKVRPIGHGIDVSDFAPSAPRPHDGTLRVVALGRYAASKGLDTVIRAVSIARGAGADVRLACHGPAGGGQDAGERDRLAALVAELGLAEAVALEDAVPRSEIPGVIARSDVLVNNMRAGATDKVVFEACASGRPVLASNPPFRTLLGGLEPPLLFEREDAEDLAGRLVALAALSADERGAIGDELRRRVVDDHSVESWAAGLVRVCEELGGQRTIQPTTSA